MTPKVWQLLLLSPPPPCHVPCCTVKSCQRHVSPDFILLPSAHLLLDTVQKFLPSAPPLVFIYWQCVTIPPLPSYSSFIFLCLLWWNPNPSDMTGCKNPLLSSFTYFLRPWSLSPSPSSSPLLSLSSLITSVKLGTLSKSDKVWTPTHAHRTNFVHTYWSKFHPDKYTHTLTKEKCITTCKHCKCTLKIKKLRMFIISRDLTSRPKFCLWDFSV